MPTASSGVGVVEVASVVVPVEGGAPRGAGPHGGASVTMVPGMARTRATRRGGTGAAGRERRRRWAESWTKGGTQSRSGLEGEDGLRNGPQPKDDGRKGNLNLKFGFTKCLFEFEHLLFSRSKYF